MESVERRRLGEQKNVYLERTSGFCTDGGGSLIGTKEACEEGAGVLGHDAEITKIHLSKDGNLMNNTYDVKLTKMNTPETDVPRLKIRKGLAPGSAGSPFYYFKPGALLPIVVLCWYFWFFCT